MNTIKTKKIARFLLLLMLIQIVSPTLSYALSGGPSQPEFQSFEPIGTSEMVNMPSGDFTYNIPLLDISGYPINIAYHSGITADMEASVVGLGWNINPGVINRNVRALPDDFNGSEDAVTKQFNMKPNTTAGGNAAISLELFGLDKNKLGLNLSANLGVFYNSYWGMGCEFGISPSLSAGSKNAGKLTASMGLQTNSQSGASFSPNLAYSKKIDESGANAISIGCGIGLQVNSREGLKALAISASASKSLDRSIKDNENISVSQSASASFSFATPSYMPQVNMDMINRSFSMRFSPVGGEIFGLDASSTFSGYFSAQKLRHTSKTNNAYGMLYAHNALQESGDNALMDFNREKDGAFAEHTVSLPIVNPGNDIYSVSGQGAGGSYQLKRGDAGVFYDAQETSTSNGGDLGLELGTGNLLHMGVDVKMNYSNSTSSKWKDSDGNDLLSSMDFRKFHAGSNGLYEAAYFKAANEMAAETDQNLIAKMGAEDAVRPDLTAASSTSFQVKSRQALVKTNGSSISVGNNDLTRAKRERRQEAISYLTGNEAQVLNANPIYHYPINSFINPARVKIERVDGIRKKHHISEITNNSNDGLRYVYGIPAYNLMQREVTFNTAGRNVNCSNGKVIYSPGIDNSANNALGQDNFYNAVETKPYAHSYLLSSVLSADYQDRTGNGITQDDPGSYTVFNYSRVHSNYKWRVPIGMNEANYSEGLMSDPDDDKGSYLYGEKEMWVIHSIESKTMRAEFEYDTQNRNDGKGVLNENGGVNSVSRSVILKKITLYALHDRNTNGANAIPIKTVHFEYNYELCPGADNSNAANKGKLTLKRLFFTFGYSQKAALSGYQFDYKNAGESYDMKSYDRWGNFKKNHANPNCKRPLPGDPITNNEFPYSEQDEPTANADAGTWCLNRIKLPSGGTIQIQYGAKHYAYVQDKHAMQMLKITGIGAEGSNSIYNNSNQFQRVFFEVLPGTTATQLKRDYLRDIILNQTYVYMKCFVRMNSTDKWEYLPVYSQISDYGVSNNRGWVDLKPVPKKDNSTDLINPIAKMAFQFIRQNMPDVAYGQTTVTPQQIEANPLLALQPIVSAATQMGQLFTGFNTAMLNREYASVLGLQRSYIRLYNPTGKKMGGGALVSKIEISDNWGQMTDNPAENFSYGQEFDYTDTEQQTDGSMRIISSGVAAYEPTIGGDENPFHEPLVINESRKWAIDNIHYTEQPFGESFMPAPEIVYSKIKVRSLQYVNVKRTGTGYTENVFYTAKDFPTILTRTDLQRLPRRINPIFSLLKIKMKEHMNSAQGFCVINNNMHGQLKWKKVYDENGTLISGITYFYKTDVNGKLKNEVDFIMPDGKVQSGLLGVDYQLYGDARESINKTIAGGIAFNLDIFGAGIPFAVPMPWPDLTRSENRFRSMSITKIIYKKGILERTEAFDLGSKVSQEQLAFDPETGNCLLSKTNNEFDDPVYNLTLPAHWSYEGMQGAYKNMGFIKQVTLSSGNCNINAADANIFMPGDELAVYANGSLSKAWILQVNKGTNQLTLIDRCGNALTQTGTAVIQIVRSGRKNMPGKEIGSISTLKNPLVGNNPKVLVLNSASEVIQSKAIEFTDEWQRFCLPDSSCGGKLNANPFVSNLRGIWRNQKSWVYQSNRKSSATITTASNIRKDGAYVNFNPFWIHQSPGNNNLPYPYRQCVKNSNNWTWANEITKFDPNGIELENRDRMGRYASEMIGYNHLLVSGVASNSKLHQIAFDGFEDYRILDPHRHFGNTSFWTQGKITTETYHTGKFALKVPALQSLSSTYTLKNICPDKPMEDNRPDGPASQPIPPKPGTKPNNCECLPSFAPSPGKYVFIAWVKEGNGLGATQYTSPKISIVLNAGTLDFIASGEIIEGWQRIYGEFNIGSSDNSILIKFINGGSQNVYFDDLKVFPFEGNMKNYVYDDLSLKVMAEIDDNGFATLYEYNAEGQLIRIKKESERGILTLKESRSALPKTNE